MGRRYKRVIAEYWSEGDLLQSLGRDKVVFPIVGQEDKIPIRSLNTYIKDYLYGSVLAIPMGTGFQQGSIVDKKGKKYKLSRKKLQDSGIMINEVRNLTFEFVELIDNEIVDFDTVKKDLISEIENEGFRHPYYDIKEQIENAKTLEELTEAMDNVPH